VDTLVVHHLTCWQGQRVCYFCPFSFSFSLSLSLFFSFLLVVGLYLVLCGSSFSIEYVILIFTFESCYIFGHCMRSEVMNVLKSFLTFAFSIQFYSTHNMLILMLDPN